MFDAFMYLVVAERLAEAERIGEQARLLRGVRRPARLRARLGRLLIRLGVWLRPEPVGRPPDLLGPRGLPLTIWPGNR